MTDAPTTTTLELSDRDKTNLLTALKTLAAQESAKLPQDFSQARLDELHALRDRIQA